MHRLDNKPINITPSEILLFCCVRNEQLRIPYFFEYYRNLGVDRFFFIDNNSDDGTTEYLLAQELTHVFHTKQSYAESHCGVHWLNKLLQEYGVGHWTITLDADELLVFPMVETVDLHKLTTYLDSVNAQGLETFLLDMYSDDSIKNTDYITGTPFITSCNFFDGDGYQLPPGNVVPVRGGPRHRLFWDGHNRDKPSPVLRKVPLIKWNREICYLASTHMINHPIQLAPITGVLQHFKFFYDFYSYSKNEVERKQHWDNAAQYKSYFDVLSQNTDLSAFYPGSLKYQDSMQLVSLGLLRFDASYSKFVEN